MGRSMSSRVADFVTDKAIAQVPRLASAQLAKGLTRVLDMAIDGFGKYPSAKRLAGRTLARKKTIEAAIDTLVRNHTILATSQGVITNIGGIVSAVIGTPINAAGIVFTQMRMAACIAHLHGYDIDDPRVRTAIAMCLLGDKELNRQIAAKKLPFTPLVVATSPVFDEELHSLVTNKVLSDLMDAMTGKRLVNLVARKVPLVGGAVGGVSDSLSTSRVASCVKKYLVPRRVQLESWPTSPDSRG